MIGLAATTSFGSCYYRCSSRRSVAPGWGAGFHSSLSGLVSGFHRSVSHVVPKDSDSSTAQTPGFPSGDTLTHLLPSLAVRQIYPVSHGIDVDFRSANQSVRSMNFMSCDLLPPHHNSLMLNPCIQSTLYTRI